ncbi:MAG: tetratricopeptide repeat protein [Isosphaeraceae bacterium]
MGTRFLLFLALGAILILIIAIRLSWRFARDRRRLSRAVELLKKGTLPSKLEQRLVAQGLDRTTAADVVESALKTLSRPPIAKKRRPRRTAATASSRPPDPGTPIPNTAESEPTTLPATPHERGVALLFKRGDYVGALEAFTQAIERDPLYPNAYFGRALALRRLGDVAAAIEDERKAEELGGSERTAWDRLVNRSRHRWQWDLDNPDWKRTDPLSRQAVLFRTLTRQIYNGGLIQWVASGYVQWIDDVIEAAWEVNTAATREVAVMLEELSRQLAAMAAGDGSPHGDAPEVEFSDEQHEVLLDRIFEYEVRYYNVESEFAGDVEKWLEAKAAPPRAAPS